LSAFKAELATAWDATLSALGGAVLLDVDGIDANPAVVRRMREGVKHESF